MLRRSGAVSHSQNATRFSCAAHGPWDCKNPPTSPLRADHHTEHTQPGDDECTYATSDSNNGIPAAPSMKIRQAASACSPQCSSFKNPVSVARSETTMIAPSLQVGADV